ncbi:hypothetical protein [Actinosynnema sp. NPDC023587]|uniref:hypothetical protein n=1 Tax=Actinosynnema sp. NPDC023587 TaxID=3154695 RepID=UPI0033D593E5
MSRDFRAEDPRAGHDPLADILSQRGSRAGAEPPQQQSRRAPAKRRANGTTRSWYLPHTVADSLSQACEQLYFDLRGTKEKSEILGVLIMTGVDNMAKVRKKLGLPPAPPASESAGSPA